MTTILPSQPFRLPSTREPAAEAKARKRRARDYNLKGGRKTGKDYAPEGSAGRLSGRQKFALATLARDAARLQYLPDAGKEHDAWRQEQAINAVGLRISQASQRHWSDLKIHFLLLCGRTADALTEALRCQGNPQRVALYKLREQLKRMGQPDAYAAEICADMFKCPLEDASAPQLWSITFTLRGRKAS